MTFEEKIYKEMIHCCFINSKKRKKFARVFKNWTQKERDDFLAGIDIYVRGAYKIKIYLDKKQNILYFYIVCENFNVYCIKYITRLYHKHGELYSDVVSFESPLI